MGFFDFLKVPDINVGVKDWETTPHAVLLDVRTPQEYREGHIPGSKNIPLQEIEKTGDLVQNRNTPLFAYCHSGARSRQAVSILQRMGFTNVKNLGGIVSYSGKVEH